MPVPDPGIAWQLPGRNLSIKPVQNDRLDEGGIRNIAAEWRLYILCKDKRRKEVIQQMQRVNAKVSGVECTEVTDATTLKKFHQDYFALSADDTTAMKLHEASLKVLENSKDKRAFTKKLSSLYKAVWKTPIMYQVSEISLSELMILRIDHVTKENFVDLHGVVGRAIFKLVEKRGELSTNDQHGTNRCSMVSCSNPLSKDTRQELRDLVKCASGLERKEGDSQVAQLLLKDIKENEVQLMNKGAMIQWTLCDRVCTENLFDSSFMKYFFRLLGYILKEYGNSEVLEKNSNELKFFKATILATIKEVKQQFHRDYSEAEMEGRRSGPTPWSADIPLVKGGLYLNLWHGIDDKKGNEFVGNQNFVLHVPHGWVTNSLAYTYYPHQSHPISTSSPFGVAVMYCFGVVT